jgi:hypothetical protein
MSESGPRPRVFIAFLLCFGGAVLGVIGFAASKDAPAVSAALKPIVKTSVVHGTSKSVLDLPKALPPSRTLVERELPPVKPAREVPSNFVDQVRQSVLGPLAIPASLWRQPANSIISLTTLRKPVLLAIKLL